MPGEAAEGQPAPINNSFKTQTEGVLEKAGVNPDPRSGLSNEVVGGLTIEGMENDPRISTIKQELTRAWELLHGSRFDKAGILSGDFQEYIYGNPADLKQGKNPASLDDRAKQVFRERFPDDARAYDEQEKVKIYDDPNQDPSLKSVEEEILRRTNTDPEVNQARTKYGEVWTRVH